MRKLILVLVLMITVVCTGCDMLGVKYDSYSKVYEMYNNMPSYTANVKVTMYSNRNENVYELTQAYKAPDKTRSETISPPEVAGIVTIINGQKAKVINPKEKNPVNLSNLSSGDTDFMYLNNFFKIYYNSESTSLTVSKNKNNEGIVFTADTGSDNVYRKVMSLKINADTLKPEVMEITGQDGRVYMKLEYTNFVANPVLDDLIFAIE